LDSKPERDPHRSENPGKWTLKSLHKRQKPKGKSLKNGKKEKEHQPG
jgi:hypothetical protein